MGYLWLKAIHVAAAVTWIGGMLAMELVVMMVPAGPHRRAVGELPMLDVVRRWDRWVTSPAMLVVWGLGITMAVEAGWLSSPWLRIKLTIVVLLSVLHGMLSGTLRRMAGDPGRASPALLRHAAPLTVAAVVLIAVLAVAKPF